MKTKITLALALALAAPSSAQAAAPHGAHAATSTQGAPAPVLAPAAAASKARKLGLPAGVIQITPCVPGMGEHWANPRDLPFGPIYGVMNDRVVFVEVMIDQKDFAAGKSWTDQLKPVAGRKIDHVNIEFQPAGHEGFEVPHYDVHAYFVPLAEHNAYCLPAGSRR